jgi:hypothetical protein
MKKLSFYVCLSLFAISTFSEIMAMNPAEKRRIDSSQEIVDDGTAEQKDAGAPSPLIVQDINLLRSYYRAIQQIRIVLEAAALKFNYFTGFTASPEPNPNYYRTPKYLFLETVLYGAGEEELVCLYTPFGKIDLLCGGLSSEILEISKSFLTNIRWNIKEVSPQDVCIFAYIQEEDRTCGQFPLKKELYEGSDCPTKLYFIQSVGNINLAQEYEAGEELVILATSVLTEEQYKKDKQQFACLSDGRNRF